MDTTKKALGAALVAASLLATAPAFASTGPVVGAHGLTSLSEMAISVDALGRPTIAGQDIARHIDTRAKTLGKQFAGNNCNCGCKPPLA